MFVGTWYGSGMVNTPVGPIFCCLINSSKINFKYSLPVFTEVYHAVKYWSNRCVRNDCYISLPKAKRDITLSTFVPQDIRDRPLYTHTYAQPNDSA